MTITITIPDPEELSHNLSDLLCWWEGFRMGLSVESSHDGYLVAQNGIDAARKLNIRIRDEVKKAIATNTDHYETPF